MHKFFWNSPVFFCDPVGVGNLISGSSAFSKTSLNIWKFCIHVLLKPGLKDFEHCLSTKWNEHSCAVVWTFFGTALLWDWNESWSFPVLWQLLSFPNLPAYWIQHLTASSFRICSSSAGIPSPPLALFIAMLPKAHLTSHSRLSGSRWVITPSWFWILYAGSLVWRQRVWFLQLHSSLPRLFWLFRVFYVSIQI